jgi:hypothetical protein
VIERKRRMRSGFGNSVNYEKDVALAVFPAGPKFAESGCLILN